MKMVSITWKKAHVLIKKCVGLILIGSIMVSCGPNIERISENDVVGRYHIDVYTTDDPNEVEVKIGKDHDIRTQERTPRLITVSKYTYYRIIKKKNLDRMLPEFRKLALLIAEVEDLDNN